MCKGNEFAKHIPQRFIVKKFAVKKFAVEKSKRFETGQEIAPKNDVLAEMTNQTKLILLRVSSACDIVKSWKYYKMIRGKTQPAHVVTILSVLLIGRILQSENKYVSSESTILKLVYLGCFSAHLGSQFWMTFVSGLSLYFALPRHTFGTVQRILFPKYFTINTILSLATLFTFVKSQTSNDHRFQIGFLITSFVIELVIRLYLTPTLVNLMAAKTQIEKEAGVGLEIGEYKPGCLAKCPHYFNIHTNFRKVHITIAIGNMISMACTFAHLFYLAQRICI